MKADKTILALLLLAVAILAAGLLYFSWPLAATGAGGERGLHEVVAATETTDFREATEANTPGPVAESSDATGGAASGASVVPGGLPAFADARAKEDYLNAMFRPLAAAGVAEALARVRQLPDEEARDMAMLALLGEWSGASMTQLVRQGDVSRFGVAGALALYLMGEGKISPQETAAMAGEFLSGDQRVGVLGRAAEKLAASDAPAALAMGDGLADWQQFRFLSHFVSGWSSAAPEQALAWVAQVEDPRTRAMLTGRVLNEQAKTDPVSAARTFTQAPPEDSRARQRTARQIAEGWAAQDTLAAMQWADQLPDEADRRAARQGIDRAAPVGIGARIVTGTDGVPVLQDFLPGAPASTSGQLRPGDRVLAVTAAEGEWVVSDKMSPDSLAALIRGEPNTQVSLKVQSSDGSGVRVVTLPRARTINRPGN